MSLMDLVLRRTPEQASSVRVSPSAESLEDVLIELSKWGKPRVGQYGSDGTWSCHMEVNITATGVNFEVRSDFKQPTPLAAALMCRQNLRDAVKAIGGTA